MNVFFLDECPIKAAQYQCDKHVVKMILETAQMLSTAHRVLDGKQLVSPKTGKPLQQFDHPLWHEELYKCAHINHPSTKWIRASAGNYSWAYQHFRALCNEYTYRYGKVHESERKLLDILNFLPSKLEGTELKANLDDRASIAINDDLDKAWDFRSASTVIEVYRRYYLYKTAVVSPFNYTKRSVPEFMLEFGYDFGAEFTPDDAPWKLGW